MDFYYFSLCHVCKNPSPDLKKCSSCKVLHYCSREHQMEDWPKHKNICKVITKTNKILVCPRDGSAEDINHFKYSSSLLWHCELGRQLDLSEHHMWMFPKLCAVCYSTEVTIICQNCLSVAYCTEEHQDLHQETHGKFCESLKLCLAIHQTLLKEEMSTDCMKFDIDRNLQSLPQTIEELLTLMGFNCTPDYSKSHIDYIIMSDFFSPVVNMIYGLEKSGFIEKRRGKKSKLIIHIVGPDVSEFKMCWPIIIDFISLWIVNLKSVKIFLIGPEVIDDEQLTLVFNHDQSQVKKFTGTVISIKGFYHDIVHFILRPDLVVAFNCGLHEFNNTERDTWRESIPKLVSFRGVPAILTAYTETELKKDVERFQESRIKFLVEPQRNPYANLRPIRNWEEGGDAVFYNNNYITVVTKN